jgi:hypothetical protein
MRAHGGSHLSGVQDRSHLPSRSQTASAATDQALISFLRQIPDLRMRCGVRISA